MRNANKQDQQLVIDMTKETLMIMSEAGTFNNYNITMDGAPYALLRTLLMSNQLTYVLGSLQAIEFSDELMDDLTNKLLNSDFTKLLVSRILEQKVLNIPAIEFE